MLIPVLPGTCGTLENHIPLLYLASSPAKQVMISKFLFKLCNSDGPLGT